MKFNIETGKSNPKLRHISAPVEKAEMKKFAMLWEEMIKYIKDPENNWVWLAAPQVWIEKRVICVSLMKTYDDKSFKTVYMINPEILSHSEEIEIDNEGCLSVPKKFWDVARAKDIKVKYLDGKWKEITLLLSGISARIVQHEVDHLDWILFIDKIVEAEEEAKNHVF
ncbi:MAG: Peptide deformylase [uncultured bacterium (gcode 4)]|uniref:Peptide deformylase n=1 Tax=uncultured bacterium (gcode 4) TaxID=1234023 RepID=K2G114_9BACT|nr:MAG: Peptide deformylase [uncultured bacterium (gcode 4)]